MFRACLGQRSAFFLFTNPLLFHPCLSVPNVCTHILHKLQYSNHVGHKRNPCTMYNVHTYSYLFSTTPIEFPSVLKGINSSEI